MIELESGKKDRGPLRRVPSLKIQYDLTKAQEEEDEEEEGEEEEEEE